MKSLSDAMAASRSKLCCSRISELWMAASLENSNLKLGLVGV